MRLINADALKEKMWRTNRYYAVKFDIDEAPTIDAVTVVHGHWIAFNVIDIKDCSSKIRYMCNKCGRYEDEQEPYCNCGAKMDEVLKNE